jgi:integrase
VTQKTTTTATRRDWSYKTGEKGRNRVRMFLWGDSIWIDYRENGRRVRKDLGHAELDRAKRLADEVAAGLGQLDQIGPPAALSVAKLFETYETEVTPTKAPATQAHDRRALKLFRKCWGGSAVVSSLDRRDWDRFIQLRRTGALTGYKARDGVIGQNLRLLLAVMHWAEAVRVKGKPMLERNPFAGCSVPAESSPRRPMLTEDEFQRVRDVAARVHRYCPLFLTLAHETGHRGDAIAQLRWSDVDLAKRTILWREDSDKTDYQHVTPISAECAEALKAAQREARTIGDSWIFPAPRDASKPIGRFRVRDWWRRLEALAKLERIPGRGWHSLRRKFATDLIDIPIAELMKIGGWRNARTIVQCYQQPREDRLRAALERRSAQRAASNGQ